MDGDSRRLRQNHHQHSGGSSGSSRGRSINRRSAIRPAGDVSDRLRLPLQTDQLQVADRSPRIPAYVDYGYSDLPSFQCDSFQPAALRYYSAATEFPRQQQGRQHTFRGHQHQQHCQSPQYHQHQISHLRLQPFAPYESDMVYHLNQPTAHPQVSCGTVTQYPSSATGEEARPPTAIGTLSPQFTVSQYFPPTDPVAVGAGPDILSPYLTSQQLPSTNSQPEHVGHTRAHQPFPATMADLTRIASVSRLDQQQRQPPAQSRVQTQPQTQPQAQAQQQFMGSDSLSIGEAYSQLQQALRRTLDHALAGRLVDASHSLQAISQWLVSNVRELGVLRDNETLYLDHLQLWNNLNICWLAVFQKQKDMIHDFLRLGQPSPSANLLAPDAMEDLGRTLIQLCDQIESHGLVDYQMGIWEEEILCIITQCLNLVEIVPDISQQGHATVIFRS